MVFLEIIRKELELKVKHCTLKINEKNTEFYQWQDKYEHA